MRWITLSLVSCLVCACAAEPAPQVSVTVGPAGGEVALEGGVCTLEIPAGALSTSQSIRITQTDEPAPSGLAALSPVFRFEPDGLALAKPAKVVMAYGGSDPQAAVHWSVAGAAFERLQSERAAGEVSASVTHFSRGLVARAAAAGGDQGTQPGKDTSGDSATDCGGLGQRCCAQGKCIGGKLICAGKDDNTCVTCGEFGPKSQEDTHSDVYQYCCPGDVCAATRWGKPGQKVFCSKRRGCYGGKHPECQWCGDSRSELQRCCPGATSEAQLSPAEGCGIPGGTCNDNQHACATVPVGALQQGYCGTCGGLAQPCCAGGCNSPLKCKLGVCGP